MTKLERIIDEINELQTIYNICNRNAGWGFMLCKEGDDKENLYVPFYRSSLELAAIDTLNYLRRIR